MNDNTHIIRNWVESIVYDSFPLIFQNGFFQCLQFGRHFLRLGKLNKINDFAMLYVIQRSAPTEHEQIGFQCHLEIVPMFIDHQIGKSIYSNISAAWMSCT